MVFRKGQSGNPGGKRKEKLGFDALMLEMAAAEEQRGMRVIARKLLDLAVSGDMQAIKEVFNRTDGMPKQSVDLNDYSNDLSEMTDDELNSTLDAVRSLIAANVGRKAGAGEEDTGSEGKPHPEKSPAK
jgi:hypothetical protein